MQFIATPRNETFVGRLGAEADIRETEDNVTCSLGIYAELVLSWLLSPTVGFIEGQLYAPRCAGMNQL